MKTTKKLLTVIASSFLLSGCTILIPNIFPNPSGGNEEQKPTPVVTIYNTITFDAGLGELVDSETTIQVVNGQCTTLPSAKRENREFVGWFTGTGEEDTEFTEETPVTKDMTLYARYSSRVTFEMLKEDIQEKDEGYSHFISKENKKFDFVGYSAEGGQFGSLAKKTIEGVKFEGVIYNRNILEGLKSIKVTYGSGELYVVFTEYLMEDMSFVENEAHLITSGEAVLASDAARYFCIYTSSETPINIDSIQVVFDEAEMVVDDRVYGDSEEYGGARSLASVRDFEYDLINLTNNPTAKTNNYSTGTNTDANPQHAWSWYRWNGIYLKEQEMPAGGKFDVQITVIGNISQVVDPSSYFHFAPWIDFHVYHEFENDNHENVLDWESGYWAFAYIGNDSYEPLGHEDPNRINKDYNDTYAGRFFSYYGPTSNPYIYEFKNPDTFTMQDGLTLREAYESQTLPIWCIFYHMDNGILTVEINGHKLPEEVLIEDYNGEPIKIKTFQLHLVNYGTAIDTPAPKYSGIFTKPRIK